MKAVSAAHSAPAPSPSVSVWNGFGSTGSAKGDETQATRFLLPPSPRVGRRLPVEALRVTLHDG